MGGAMAMRMPIPEIYVFWHPSCVLGEPLAKRIADGRARQRLCPDVFFRSLPETAAPGTKNVLPLPLAIEKRGDANRLLTTRSISDAVRLTRKGLGKRLGIDFDQMLA
jgi:hypothetical protein